ncbi:hypothetical protein KXV98_005949 [Aspergillus fumigatus]|nr:hypothetical protein KXV98_005949 [Aspergillus fumigatus]
MVHPVIPTVRTTEILPAKPTGALLWRLALLVPSAGANILKTGLEILLSLRGGIGPRCMHPALMSAEEILAVDVAGLVAIGSVAAVADVATEEAKLDVFRGNVSFPFILGGKGACATIV